MKLKLGIVLILASFLPWLALPFALALAQGTASRTLWSGGLVLLGEILFWPGLALAGRETWITAKQKGWRNTLPELWRQLNSSSKS